MKIFFVKILIISLVILSTPAIVNASKLNISIGSSEYDLQSVFVVDIYLDTDKTTLNAIQTEVSFDVERLRLLELVDSASAINFWIEKNINAGYVYLSGITPGGFNGNNSKIITLVFESVGSGVVKIDVKNTRVFLNDGLGTMQDVSNEQKSIIISEKVSQNKSNNNRFSSDTEAPESFSPEVSRSTALFDNKWFLVFQTQDKNSGVSHYLIKEARFRPLMFFKRWSVVESPYLLRDQSRTSFIAIKAVDKAGNEAVEKVYPENSKSLLQKIIGTAIIILAILILVFLIRKLLVWSKKFGE